MSLESVPIVGAAISYAGAQVDDNIIAIAGISAVLCVAMVTRPFDEASMFALTMSGISGVAALAGYEIGKRKNDEKA